VGTSLYLVGLLLPTWFPSEAGTWEQASTEICISANARNTSLTSVELRVAMEAAVASWFAPAGGGARVCGGFDLGFDDRTCRARSDGQDGRTELYFRQDWPYGPATIGFTASTVDTSRTCRVVQDDSGRTRRIPCRVGSDVELNDDSAWWGRGGTVGVDVQTVVAHEVGHVLGLGHCEENGTCGPGEALMFGGYTGPQPGPAEDDDEGLCALYPEPTVGLGAACGNDAACAEGQCAPAETAGRCVPSCDGGCPSGQSCSGTVCAGDLALCQSCDQDQDCGLEALCVGGRCRPRCGGGCPDGTVCGVGAGGRRSCVGGCPGEARARLGESCDGRACEPDLDCAGGICRQACEGTCPGSQACVDRFGGRYCLEVVFEGESCDDQVLCPSGPCLATPGSDPICVRACVGAPCGAGQRCEMVSLRPGAATRICTPTASPPDRPGDLGPRPDAGHRDLGASGPDAGLGGSGGDQVPTIEGTTSCACSGARRPGASPWLFLGLGLLLIRSRPA
jgi:hypothetical protein